MARRGLNIYRRKDGRWEGRVRLQNPEGGRGKYRSVYGHSYREAREKKAALEAEQHKAAVTKRCGLTVGEVVAAWIRDRKGAWKESTLACYMRIVERYISGDGIGGHEAASFTNVEFRTFLEGVRRKGDGERISAAYACSIGTVLRQAYAHAASEYGYDLPRLSARVAPRLCRAAEIPSEGAMTTLKDYLLGHADNPTCLGVLLACCTGIRIGELCALTWSDINFEEGVLEVRRNMQRVKDCGEGGAGTRILLQTPKTLSSARRIPLPDELLGVLMKNRRPAGEYLVSGKRKPWAEARTLQYRFAALLRKCGIGHFRFHALRHYFASLCIRLGFDAKSLSEILGHVNTQITLNLYVHTTVEHKRKLMNKAFCGEGA